MMEIIEELERDEKLRKRFTRLIVSELLLDPELRLLLVEKGLETLATKEDVKNLKKEIDDLRKEIKDVENKLRNEIKEAEERLKSYEDVKFDSLNKIIDDVNKRMDDLFKVVSATLIAIVVGIVSLFVSKLFA